MPKFYDGLVAQGYDSCPMENEENRVKKILKIKQQVTYSYGSRSGKG